MKDFFRRIKEAFTPKAKDAGIRLYSQEDINSGTFDKSEANLKEQENAKQTKLEKQLEKIKEKFEKKTKVKIEDSPFLHEPLTHTSKISQNKDNSRAI